MNYISDEYPKGEFFDLLKNSKQKFTVKNAKNSKQKSVKFEKSAFFAKKNATALEPQGLQAKNGCFPLGYITKLQATLENQGLRTNFENAKIRAMKFVLQDLACKYLTKVDYRGNHKSFVHRVNYCLRRRVDVTKGVLIRYNEKRQKAHYHNLQRCGSVWTCAVCAVQITEIRRIELRTAIDNWNQQGGVVYLVTFTNRHHCGDDLAGLLLGQKKAFVKFWEKRKVKETLNRLGYAGRIVSTEVLYGENGWHPHYHMLFFFDHEINQQGLQSFLALEWQDVCRKVGLKIPSLEHGVDVRDGSYADKYVTKFGSGWGLDYEITKGHTKKGREGGLTPFDLLRESVEMPSYGALFSVYADVFKGKQQLHWSSGLKAKLGVLERSDDELAKQTEGDSIELKELALEIWYLIARYKMRAEYLEAIEQDYQDGGNRADKLVKKLVDFYVKEISD